MRYEMRFAGKSVTRRMASFGVTSLVRYEHGAIMSHRDAVTGRIVEWFCSDD